MLKCVTFAAVLVACFGVARAQPDEAKAEAIRKEIGELRAKLAAKEVELAKVLPVTSRGPINIHDAEFGRVGVLSMGPGADAPGVFIDQVIDDNSFIGRPNFVRMPPQSFLFRMPTKGLVDGRHDEKMARLTWRVSGRVKVGGRTLFEIEPYADR